MALIIIVLMVAILLFRGWFYRQMVTYRSLGQRPDHAATDEDLLGLINESAPELTDPDIVEVIRLALAITAHQLNFTAQNNHTDPNKLISSRTAHCVGYAAFFATTCNVLLAKYDLGQHWRAIPQVGQLHVFGTNVHRYVSTPFFKDHDFVTIENSATGEIFAVDPTLKDYLFIDFVTYEK